MENTRKQPAYLSVYEEIKEKIINGVYTTGSLLPPEPQLEKKFFVSRTTIRRAIGMLSNEGLLRVKQGRGTEVINRKVAQNLNTVSSVSETLEGKGYRIGTKSIYICTRSDCPAVCKELHLPKNTKLIEINRIQTADDLPVAISKNYIPYFLVPGLEHEKEKIISLYKFLSEHYNVNISGSHDIISACNASFEESELLRIEPGTALITIRRVCYSAEVPIEFDDVKIIASKYEFETSSCAHFRK